MGRTGTEEESENELLLFCLSSFKPVTGSFEGYLNSGEREG
jgi:hypothetical protein